MRGERGGESARPRKGVRSWVGGVGGNPLLRVSETTELHLMVAGRGSQKKAVRYREVS